MGYSVKSYIEILKDNLLEIWEPGFAFMQNNAPIHKVKKVMKWFENNGVVVTDWPPYSPDLNPIEHLRYELKKIVYKVNPDIDSVTGSEEHVRKVF